MTTHKHVYNVNGKDGAECRCGRKLMKHNPFAKKYVYKYGYRYFNNLNA